MLVTRIRWGHAPPLLSAWRFWRPLGEFGDSSGRVSCFVRWPLRASSGSSLRMARLIGTLRSWAAALFSFQCFIRIPYLESNRWEVYFFGMHSSLVTLSQVLKCPNGSTSAKGVHIFRRGLFGPECRNRKREGFDHVDQ
jgi:hypothetical protein